MTETFWPWWQGAPALAAVAVGHAWFLYRPLGVSGLFTYFVDLRAQLAVARADSALLREAAAFEAALVAATLKAQGGMGMTASLAGGGGSCTGDAPADVPADAAPGAPPADAGRPLARPTWGMHATFMVALVAGGALCAWLRGGISGLQLQWDPGPTFSGFFGHGASAWAVLFAGGALVGAGTRMAGGCTSGHGLSGVARLQPGSLAATCAFFGAAVATSLLLSRVLA